MHSIHVETIHPSALVARCGARRLSQAMLDAITAWPGPACTVVPDPHGRWGELVIWLPGTPAAVLESLARQCPTDMNIESADYTRCRTMLCWQSPCGVEIQVDVWALNDHFLHWSLDNHRSPGFGVVFLSEVTAQYASHRLDGEDYESLVCGLQASSSSSGPNYKPWRIYGDEFMEQHAGKADEEEPGVVRPAVLHWKQAG